MTQMTPLGAVRRGLLAGALGTAAMTGWQALSSRLQDSGGDGSGPPPADPWQQASTPAKVAKRIGEGVFGREVGPELIPVLTHGMHWLYGTSWGAVYGLTAGSARGRSPIRRGLAFGTGVWLMSYAQLVPMGLYQPPWQYPPEQLALDYSYHAVYGTAAGAAFALLART